MERNTVDEMIEICQAIKDGKKIEWYGEHSEKWFGLSDDEKPDFDHYTYRIKPEEPKKKWRPFKDTAELFAHNNGSDILWLKRGKSKMLVTEYTDFRVTLDGGVVGIGELLKYFTFADGTPCGVEEDA